jgi:Ser/Thr protein kinase RdoA (MazF antagonist)
VANPTGDRSQWQDIAIWCRRELGSPPRVLLFAAGHISKVIGVELENGRQVVIKLRPADDRVSGAIAVQRLLFERGFSCPEPLTGPSLLGEMLATAEAFVPTDALVGRPPADECAEMLATLVALAGDPTRFPALASTLPWVAWDQPEAGNWPTPDDLDVDLNQPPGPPWLEDAAEAVRSRLAADYWPTVIGHCDWEAHNMGWREGHVAVVYDWDSLGTRSEPAIAGTAAAVFASAPHGPVAADLQQTQAFLDAYRKARPGWDDDATEIAYAAGLWVLLYNARKELAGGGGGYLDHLSDELQVRLRHAGAWRHPIGLPIDG